MKKIGFDVHGVIDDDPEFFSSMSNLIEDSGNEVHIITGSHASQQLLDMLAKYDIRYSCIYSITDWATTYKLNDGTLYDPIVDSFIWDSRKAWYCDKYNIDLHIDDSSVYKKYFIDGCKYITYDASTINNQMKIRSNINAVIENVDDKIKKSISSNIAAYNGREGEWLSETIYKDVKSIWEKFM